MWPTILRSIIRYLAKPRTCERVGLSIDTATLQGAIINDVVRFAHLAAMALGLGSSLFADFRVLRHLRAPVSAPLLDVLHQCHRLVWFSILAMWITGTILVYLRTGFIWENVSPKLMTKGVVVVVLTLNAWLIGTVAMRRVERSLGKSLLEMPKRVQLPLSVISGVSTASWLLALALGCSAVLAASSASVLFPLTCAIYSACIVASLGAAIVLKRGQHLNEISDTDLTIAK